MSHATPDDDDQRALVRRAQAGDIEAFNELINRYQRVAYSVALRLLGDPDLAADATQDAMISAFRSLGSLRGGSFRLWLLRIVTNQCLDCLRARQRRPTVSLDALTAGSDDASRAVELPAVDGDPAALAEQRELRELVQRGLLTLVEDQRVAVILSDVEGFSYEEIAAITQANVGTVKSRIARGRARLRDWLSRYRELLPHSYRRLSEDDAAPSTPNE
jgi:RNA polymerase sigma-70 factor (ECF subfamily)